MAKVLEERQVLAEMLQLYKERPCLWDQNHGHYNDKAYKQQSYTELLEIYRLVCEDATIETVKKKIEYMRCAYRRERRKVITARAYGEEHKPVLWYYDYLTFLHDDNDFNCFNLNASKLETTTYLQENEDGAYELEEIPKKRSKIEEILLTVPMSPSENSNSNNSNDQTKEKPEEESAYELEPEAFGRTVGLQLSELNSTNRYIAEKLISDVIFYARLGKLTADSSIVL